MSHCFLDTQCGKNFRNSYTTHVGILESNYYLCIAGYPKDQIDSFLSQENGTKILKPRESTRCTASSQGNNKKNCGEKF